MSDVVRWSRVGYLDLHLPHQPALNNWPSPLRTAAKRWLFGTIAHVPESEKRDVVVAWVSRPRENLLFPLQGVPPLGIRELNELLDRMRGPVDVDEHERLASTDHWRSDRP